MRSFILIFIFGGILVACKSTNKVVLEKRSFPFSEIVFGQGGGFTGKVKQYSVKSTGMVYEIILNDTIQVKKLDDSTMTDCFEKVEQLHLEGEKINEPGNMYYFIKYYKGPQEVTAIWGNPKFKESEALTACYNYLYKVSR